MTFAAPFVYSGVGVLGLSEGRGTVRNIDADRISEAIVVSIGDSAIPRVDRQKLIDRYGEADGSAVANRVVQLVREAVAMPIDWGDMALAESVNDIMGRFRQLHPELSAEALEEMGRCVGWNLR